MELGKQIKNYRKKGALSQDVLAEKVYVSRQTISNWENDVSQTKGYQGITCVYLLANKRILLLN